MKTSREWALESVVQDFDVDDATQLVKAVRDEMKEELIKIIRLKTKNYPLNTKWISEDELIYIIENFEKEETNKELT